MKTRPRHRAAGAAAGFFACLLTLAAAAEPDLQAQIDAARPGDTLHVPSGVFGPIVVNKGLTLIGDGIPEIRGGGKGKVVRITAPDVTLRGFRIAGSGLSLFDDDAAVHVTGDRAVIEDCVIEDSLHGIYLKKVDSCRVVGNRIRGKTQLTAPSGPVEAGLGRSAEDCDTGELVANRRGNGLHQWNCEHTYVAGNEISDTRDGIYFSFTNQCRVERNLVHDVRYGLHYMYSDENVFEDNVFTESAAGAAIMFSKQIIVRRNRFVSNRGLRGYGIILQSTDTTLLDHNEVRQNAVGLSFNQCNGNTITGNRITENYIGLRLGSNSDSNRFSENVLVKNLHPVELGGETSGNQWSIAGVGNLWGDAAGLDLDGDGINDLPHRELDLFGVLRRDFPPIALLSESPGVKMLRFAHARATLPGVAVLVDPAPLAPTFWQIRARRAAEAFRSPPAAP